MTSDAEILAALQAVAEEHLDYEGTLAPDTVLVDALQLDSIRLLTFVVETENHFEICLEEGDEEGIATTADLMALVRQRLDGVREDPQGAEA